MTRPFTARILKLKASSGSSKLFDSRYAVFDKMSQIFELPGLALKFKA